MTVHESREGAGRFETLVSQRSEAPQSRLSIVGAGLALLALLIGLPVVLWVLSGPPPIPTELPGLKELAKQLSIEEILTVLVGIVWLAWAYFLVCVVLEFIAARRGGLATPVPLGGPMQRLARVLIGALILTGIGAGPASAATADVPTAPTTVSTVGISGASFDAEIATVETEIEQRAEVQNLGDKVYTVQAPKDGYHDNLWDIAERHLGDGRRYVEIFELNKDKVQSDGGRLQLARLIQPGWELSLPDDAVGVERVALAGGGSGALGDVAAVDGAGGAQVDTGAQDGAGGDVVADEAESRWAAVGDWAAGSGLLAATVFGALLLLRRRGIGSRPTEDARSIEADLRVAATPERVNWLDAALRSLSAGCREAGIVPPPVYAVLLSDDAVELLLSPAAPQGIDGWAIHDEGRRWRRERTELVPVADVSPYPALVSLGVDLEGRDVLIDLEAAGGIIAIGGDGAVAEQVAAAIAVQASTAPWSDSVAVIASHLPDGLADIGVERLRMVGDLGEELDALEQHVRNLPDDVLQGRLSRRSPAPSRLVVAGRAPEASVADRLGALAGGTARALSVVVAGEHGAARWRLRVDDHGNLQLPQLGLTVVANRIGPAQVDAVAGLFAAAEVAPDATDHIDLPSIERRVDDASWATSSHRVGVLGKVFVQGAGTVVADVPRIDQSTEIVTYLALHPEGVHPTVLSSAVWPRGVTQDVLDAAVTRTRAWLGDDVDGTHLLRADATGRLSLADSVVTDWHVLVTLLHTARRATRLGEETDLLRRALLLVRGAPFESVPSGRYAWVARDDLPRSIGAVIVDAAERLVTILAGDPTGAAAAAETGLLAVPGHQPLWRSLIRARHALEGAAGVQRTLRELDAALVGLPIDAETEALVEELLPQGGAQSLQA